MKEEFKLKQNTLIILIKEKIHIILKYCHLKQHTLKIWQKKARETIDDLQLDKSLGDRIFCLVDLDLSTKQLKKMEIKRDFYLIKLIGSAHNKMVKVKTII